MNYPLAERFKAPQGEGLYTGTQMAFLRLVGCSVGKRTCTACDTDFETLLPALGGGLYTPEELADWSLPCAHACVTGGEPLDRDLRPLLAALGARDIEAHVETSGTRWPDWLDLRGRVGAHMVAFPTGDLGHEWRPTRLWLTVSPKPGYREEMVERADEVKVILGGLGDGPGWPTLEDAVRWADDGRLVYVQPRNLKLDVDRAALAASLEAVARHPRLRLSAQLHKFLRTR